MEALFAGARSQHERTQGTDGYLYLAPPVPQMPQLDTTSTNAPSVHLFSRPPCPALCMNNQSFFLSLLFFFFGLSIFYASAEGGVWLDIQAHLWIAKREGSSLQGKKKRKRF